MPVKHMHRDMFQLKFVHPFSVRIWYNRKNVKQIAHGKCAGRKIPWTK